MFHVEHSLADAETPEQRVEHVLDAGATGDAVERDPGLTKMLGNEQNVALPFRQSQFLNRFGDPLAMARVERDAISWWQ